MLNLRKVAPRITNLAPQFLRSFSKGGREAGGDHIPFACLYWQTNHFNISQGLKNVSCHFSTMAGTVLFQAWDTGKFHEDLENAIHEHRLSDAWDLHEKHMLVEGFARKSTLSKLIAVMTESLDLQWVEKAFGLVEKAFLENKHTLFDRETLIYLSLGLSKCGLPVPASILLRKLIEMEHFPPVSAWSAILAYMSVDSAGAYLAAELVLEIGYMFQDGRIDSRKKSNEPLIAMKPNLTAFTIALVGCLLFGATRKAEQLIDMMPRINMKPDATLLIIMAHIYERNGRREELKKIKRHVDEVQNITEDQFRQFYNLLLSCHLQFEDLDSATQMVLEMLRKGIKAQNSLVANLIFEADRNHSVLSLHNISVKDSSQIQCDQATNSVLLQNFFLSYEDFCKDRKFMKLELEAKKVLGILMMKLPKDINLITCEKGILMPTEKSYAKLVKLFLQAGKLKDLVEFLIKAEKVQSPVSDDSSALVNVINSCISLRWLDQAHDLLDEMRLAGIRTSSSVYDSLMNAYCEENRMDEVASLMRDARKAGVQLSSNSYEVMIRSRVIENDTRGALNLFKEMKQAKIPRGGHPEIDKLIRGSTGQEADLMTKLLHEIKEGQTVDSGVHDWNNVINFFCKKRLMQDAEKALKKMMILGHAPNAQTFHSMVTGYAAIGGKYIEVTELWGEMKSYALSSGMKFDQELLDAVLYTFVRGGFFIRANEVVEMMANGDMFVDKYKYRTLFLKFHKTLYKGKAPKFQTESQLKKREAALAFKKWVGL